MGVSEIKSPALNPFSAGSAYYRPKGTKRVDVTLDGTAIFEIIMLRARQVLVTTLEVTEKPQNPTMLVGE